jgi:hypothetical protein
MKKIFFIFGLVATFLLLFKFSTSFALLESKAVHVVSSDVATWSIIINNTDISNSSTSFVIDQINWDSSDNVKEGKVAPGIGGYFDIIIDPSNTDVSIMYNLIFDFSSLENTDIEVESISEISNNEIVRTGQNTYTGIINLSDINNGITNDIRVNLKWNNNEENNEYDYELGKNANTILEIPVSVEVFQYTGEDIIEYTE